MTECLCPVCVHEWDELAHLIYEFAGSASMCWEDLSQAGLFDSETASDLAHKAYLKIRAIYQDKLEIESLMPAVEEVNKAVEALASVLPDGC